MQVLAIETATSVCSVALIEARENADVRIVDHAHIVVGRGHAERLLPMIAGLVGGGRADAIAVDVGPGSFTGVRVGVAAARALGFGWGVPVTGFASLALIAVLDGAGDGVAEDGVAEDGVAEDGSTDDGGVTVAIEGGHGELFVARYVGSPPVEVVAPRSVSFDDAVVGVKAHRIIGNAAARLIAARGWGVAIEVEPDARGFALLPAALASLTPLPRYARGADAKPMA